MVPNAAPASLDEIRALRLASEKEIGGQIVHDSLHLRPGWTQSFLLRVGADIAGYGSIAVAGPWQDKPTVFEFHLVPAHRTRAFALFEVFLAVSGTKFFEVQTNHPLLTAMLHTYAHDIVSEKIVFEGHGPTALPSQGALLRRVTAEAELHQYIERRQGCAEWALDLGRETVATGGLCFHYNAPYCDIFYDVAESYRRRGLGAFFVQELKRTACALGAIPAARCSPDNVASRLTLQKAGLVPRGHILLGTLNPRAVPASSAPSAPSTPRG